MGIHLRGKYRHDVNEECIKKKNVYNGLEVTFMNKHFPQCMGPLALMAIKNGGNDQEGSYSSLQIIIYADWVNGG